MSTVRINKSIGPELQTILDREEQDKQETLHVLKNQAIVHKTEEEVNAAVNKVARQIHEKHRNTPNLVLVTLLEGGSVFASAVKRELEKIDEYFLYREASLAVGRYENEEQGGKPVITLMPKNIVGRHIICIEDLIDEGDTVKFVREALKPGEEGGVASVEFATLIHKVNKNLEFKKKHNLFPTFNGIDDPEDLWLIGMGMDNGKYGRQKLCIYAKVSEQQNNVKEAELKTAADFKPRFAAGPG